MSNKDGTVAIYAPKAFKLNTGDPKLGNAGVIDIPAGASRIDAKWAAHKWVKIHTGEAPGADAAGDLAAVADIEIGELRAKLAEAHSKLAEAEATIKAQGEELEGMRVAMAQTADERVKEAEGKTAAARAECDSLRADLAKAKSGKR